MYGITVFVCLYADHTRTHYPSHRLYHFNPDIDRPGIVGYCQNHDTMRIYVNIYCDCFVVLFFLNVCAKIYYCYHNY